MKKKCLLPALVAILLVSVAPLTSATHPPGTPVHILFSVSVTSGEWLAFSSGWAAKMEEQVIQYLDNTLLAVEIDGEEIENPKDYFLDVAEYPDLWFDLNGDGEQQDIEVGWWVSFWVLESHPLAVGEHGWSWKNTFTADVTDGIDFYPEGLVLYLETPFYVEPGKVNLQ